MAQSGLVVHIPHSHDQEQFVDLYVICPGGGGRSVASIWGRPEVKRPVRLAPRIMVVVHDGPGIAAFLHCDRVTANDPLSERWAEEEAIEAADLICADPLPA